MVLRALACALVVVAAVAPVAVADKVVKPKCGAAKQTKKAPRTVREVDWCNADVGGWKGPLHAGRSDVHLYSDIGEAHDTVSMSLRGVVYGDLDGDKQLEAAVVIESSTWIASNGNHSGGTSVRIYRLVKGKPVHIGSIPAGTPVEAITFAKGNIRVTSGAGTGKTTLAYRRNGDDFEPVN